MTENKKYTSKQLAELEAEALKKLEALVQQNRLIDKAWVVNFKRGSDNWHCGYITFNKKHVYSKVAKLSNEGKLDIDFTWDNQPEHVHKGCTYQDFDEAANTITLGFDLCHAGDEELIYSATGKPLNYNKHYAAMEVYDWAIECTTYRAVLNFECTCLKKPAEALSKAETEYNIMAKAFKYILQETPENKFIVYSD